MNVFLAWSGATSKTVAEALRDWTPRLNHLLKPWMSDQDVKVGARWSSDIAGQLEDAHVGIICLTPDNLREPWILFEAGALSKAVGESLVCPYLFGLQPTDLTGPLAQFQAARADKEDTRKLMHTINNALDRDHALPNLNEAFDEKWPRLEEQLKQISTQRPPSSPPERTEHELLEEILMRLRAEEWRQRSQPMWPPHPDLAALAASPLAPPSTGPGTDYEKLGRLASQCTDCGNEIIGAPIVPSAGGGSTTERLCRECAKKRGLLREDLP